MASFASLIRSARAATKEAKPFFSAVDKAALDLQRAKGTGKEFMTELKKTKGVKIENIFVCDSKGVIYEGRPGGYDESKARFAQKTDSEFNWKFHIIPNSGHDATKMSNDAVNRLFP